MSARCPEPSKLLALAEGQLDTGEAETAAAHLEICAICRTQVEEHQALAMALAELGRAERGLQTPGMWARVHQRIERPALAVRMPLGVAAVWRGFVDLARPAVAASLAAAAVGLSAGTWLAIAAQRGPTGAALASETYTGSSLVSESPAGFAEYLSSTDSNDFDDDALDPAARGDTLAGDAP